MKRVKQEDSDAVLAVLEGIKELGIEEYLASIRSPTQEVRRVLLVVAQRSDISGHVHETIIRWVNNNTFLPSFKSNRPADA